MPSPAVREHLGRTALARVGVDVSPEFAAALFDPARFTADSGGAQAGKSTLAAARTWVALWTDVAEDSRRSTADPSRYWYIVPSYKAPHKEIDYLTAWGEADHILSYKHVPEAGSDACVLKFWGGRAVVETRTGQQPQGIAGESCDGVCIVEAGQQPEAVWTASRNRVTSRRGWMNANGTLEDDDNHPRWAWFPELCAKWYDNPLGSEERAHKFPTWANRHDYPLGRQDPEILSMERMYDEWTFARRVAGIAGGTQFPAYPALNDKQRITDPFLKAMPYTPCKRCNGSGNSGHFACRDCKGLGRVLPWVWLDHAGGVDFGLGEGNHPSTLVVVSLASTGVAWVRCCHVITTGDADDITNTQAMLSQKYDCWNWGWDTMQSWAAKLSDSGAVGVSGTAGSRDMRIALVRSRHRAHTLMYDTEGEGVSALYSEAAGVRYVKNSQGQLVLRRIGDDRTAAKEHAIERLDASEGALPVLSGYQQMREANEEPRPMDRRAFDPLPQEREDEADGGASLLFGVMK